MNEGTFMVSGKVRTAEDVQLRLREFDQEESTYLFSIEASTEAEAREAAARFREEIEWMSPDG